MLGRLSQSSDCMHRRRRKEEEEATFRTAKQSTSQPGEMERLSSGQAILSLKENMDSQDQDQDQPRRTSSDHVASNMLEPSRLIRVKCWYHATATNCIKHVNYV